MIGAQLRLLLLAGAATAQPSLLSATFSVLRLSRVGAISNASAMLTENPLAIAETNSLSATSSVSELSKVVATSNASALLPQEPLAVEETSSLGAASSVWEHWSLDKG